MTPKTPDCTSGWARARSRLNLLRNERGSIDLGSVMVGALVIGFMSSATLVSVSTVVPWTQNNAARSALRTVAVAQSVEQVKDGTYLPLDQLVADGAVLSSNTISVATDEGGTCYIAAARSDSDATFISTSRDDGVQKYQPGVTDTAWCTPAADVVAGLSPAAPAITTLDLPKARLGRDYSQALAATGWNPITFAVTNGALPGGLTLNPATGRVTGTPTTPGDFTFDVTATNTLGDSEPKTFTITAVGNTPVVVVPAAMPIAMPAADSSSGAPAVTTMTALPTGSNNGNGKTKNDSQDTSSSAAVPK